MAPSVLVNVSVHVWEISVEAHNRMPLVRGFAGVLAGSECFVTLIRTAGEFPQGLCRDPQGQGLWDSGALHGFRLLARANLRVHLGVPFMHPMG